MSIGSLILTFEKFQKLQLFQLFVCCGIFYKNVQQKHQIVQLLTKIVQLLGVNHAIFGPKIK